MAFRPFAAAAFLLSVFLTCAVAESSLYQDLGGADGIARLANAATDSFLADPRIKHQWDESDMTRFRKMLAEQFCVISGGPCRYTGHDMASAHKALHLTDADFNATVEDLQKAMDGLEINFQTQNRFLALLAPMHRDVVTR